MSKFLHRPNAETLEWFKKIGIDYTNARRIEIVFEVGAAVTINIERFADDAILHEEPPQELKDAIVSSTLVGRLRSTPAVTMDHAQVIRTIRNACREGFSRFNESISAADQEEFWKLTEGKRRAWLYWKDPNPMPVGFGMLLLQDDGLWTTTVAVLPQHTGLGFGKAITHDIVRMSPGPCRAQARKDNPAAVKLHRAEDWLTVDGPDPSLVYFRTKPGVTA